jgi:enoyl-CoA hydratase
MPQFCVRSDRTSVYEQFALDMPDALAREFALGLETLRSGESRAGAERFATGKGRGGRFDDL